MYYSSPNKKQLIPFGNRYPSVSKGTFIAPNAILIGDVRVEEGVSIWFGAVLRGDQGTIIVKANARVQDNVVVSVLSQGQTIIEEEASIAHKAILVNCKIGRGAIIGMRASVLEYASIGDKSLLAAGSIIARGTSIPPYSLASGNPAAVKKKLSGNSLWYVEHSTSVYNALRDNYLSDTITPS